MDIQFTALLLARVQDTGTVMLLCWIRIWVVFSVVPLFGNETLPSLAKASVTVSLSLLLFPVIQAELAVTTQEGYFWFAGIIIKEAFLGLLLGYTVAVLFWGISGIGFFIDNQRGASMASSINPMIGDQASPLGSFLLQLLVTLMFITDGASAFVEGLYDSYALWPVTSFYPTLDLDRAIWFLHQFDDMMYMIVFLGGPIIVFMFLAEFGLALVGRFAPQLNVFFLAMPIKSGIAFLILALYIGTLMKYFGDDLNGLRFIPMRLDEVLR